MIDFCYLEDGSLAVISDIGSYPMTDSGIALYWRDRRAAARRAAANALDRWADDGGPQA